MNKTSLECRGLDVIVAGRTLVADLSLALTGGACVAVLGRNGAGKTLTLHTLAGLRRPGGGSLAIDGRPLAEWPRRALARRLGLLMQNYDEPFPSTVQSSVLIGRHPHLGFLQWEAAEDLRRARAAIDDVGLQDFTQRDVTTLSGGELRRVAIATLLAQDPDIMLLDEPSNHLDLNHQLMTLRVFVNKARAGRLVIISLHDVNLALRYCDHALLLFGDGEWQFGASKDVISASNLSRLYQTPVNAFLHDDRPFFFAA